MEESLRARLLANAALAALVGTRITWIDRPQGAALPSVTLQGIVDGRAYTFAGADGLTGSLTQIDCWGASYASAKAVARAVIAAMEPAGIVGGIGFEPSTLDTGRDMPVEDIDGGTKIYRVSQDWNVWWRLA